MNRISPDSNLNESPTGEQPPKRGQKLCSQSVLYSDVPLYRLLCGLKARVWLSIPKFNTMFILLYYLSK